MSLAAMMSPSLFVATPAGPNRICGMFWLRSTTFCVAALMGVAEIASTGSRGRTGEEVVTYP